MDPTVPRPAAKLLLKIYTIETGKTPPDCYNVVYAHKKMPKPITTMTVDEWIAAGPGWTRNHGSSAAGAAQFMRATLQDLKRELGLRGSQIMNADLQDRLAYHLLKRRGYDQFMAGKMSMTEFGKRLAMEWASFPVLADTQGAHRAVPRGSSYYMGDKLNKSLVKPHEVEAILLDVLNTKDQPAKPVAPRPDTGTPAAPAESTSKTAVVGIVALIGAAIAAAWQWLVN